VGTVVLGDGVDEAEFFSEQVVGIGEDGEGQAVLAAHEVALPFGLGADGDHKGVALAECSVEVAPGFKLGDAVGAPAATKELDDEWPAKGEHVVGADEAAGSVIESKVRGDCADGEDAVFNAGEEEICDSLLADGQALGLHEVAGVGGDLVELVLKGCGGHYNLPESFLKLNF